jgi:hypothetical protein
MFVLDITKNRYVRDVRPDPSLPALFGSPIGKIIQANESENMEIIEAGNIPPFGLVSFIDELVHQ